ncbi:MAG TPA: MFS transporter, partial [Candidatus Nanoarchaeia archaeon]|nr:MFS transporter [Candidatus Nanoarchaeia archaeon]
VARLISTVFKSMMLDKPSEYAIAEKFTLADFVRRMDKTNYGHFVIYIALFKLAVSLASPFFAVYMLKNLGFSYLQFTIITASELVASFLAMGYWGKTIDSKGTKHVLYITGLLTPLIPLLWLISGNFYFLLIAEAFAGFAWAGFNLSSSNFIFDAVKPENRIRCSAYFKFFESMSIFLGAALGGLIVSNKPSIILMAAIPFVFLLSGILRLFVSLVLLSTLKEARLIEVPVTHSFFRKYLSIRPNQGLVFEVLGKYHKFEGKIGSVAKDAYKSAKNTKEKITKEIKNQGQYGKSILKFMDKQSNAKKEEKSSVGMAEVERITEEIERGKLR